jgi:hypothetical protein
MEFISFCLGFGMGALSLGLIVSYFLRKINKKYHTLFDLYIKEKVGVKNVLE